MPIAGSVGAISAANRAARNRRLNTTCKSTQACKYTSAASTLKKAPVAQASDISETASVDSKPSVLSLIKQQVQETGGYFKKQRDALAEKVQKGLKMTSGKKDVALEESVQKGDASAANSNHRSTAIVEEPGAKKNTEIDPAWIASLQQMGFEPSKVQEAVEMVGGQPAQMDDLLQVLVAMHASGEEPEPTTSAGAVPATSLQAPAAKSKAQGTEPHKEECALPKSTPPPVPQMSAVGSAEFEMASELHTRSAVGSVEFEMATDRDRFLRPAAPAPQSQRPEILTPSALLTLQQMGFQPESIHQATLRLGPKASFEELFDMLLAMGAPLSPPNSGGATSSTDPLPGGAAAAPVRVRPSLQAIARQVPKRTIEEEADLCSPATAAALVAELVQEVAMTSFEEALGVDASMRTEAADQGGPELVIDVDPESPQSSGSAQAAAAAFSAVTLVDAMGEAKVADQKGLEEISNHELAKSIVATVVARASEALLSRKEVAMQPKHMVNEPFAGSPVKGGA